MSPFHQILKDLSQAAQDGPLAYDNSIMCMTARVYTVKFKGGRELCTLLLGVPTLVEIGNKPFLFFNNRVHYAKFEVGKDSIKVIVTMYLDVQLRPLFIFSAYFNGQFYSTEPSIHPTQAGMMLNALLGVEIFRPRDGNACMACGISHNHILKQLLRIEPYQEAFRRLNVSIETCNPRFPRYVPQEGGEMAKELLCDMEDENEIDDDDSESWLDVAAHPRRDLVALAAKWEAERLQGRTVQHFSNLAASAGMGMAYEATPRRGFNEHDMQDDSAGDDAIQDTLDDLTNVME